MPRNVPPPSDHPPATPRLSESWGRISAPRKISPTGVCSLSSRSSPPATGSSWRGSAMPLQADRRLQVGGVAPGDGHAEVAQAGQLQQVGAVEEALDAGHVVQVDHVGAVHAQEALALEADLELAQGLADVVA